MSIYPPDREISCNIILLAFISYDGKQVIFLHIYYKLVDNLVQLSCSVKEIAHSIVILFALPECLFNPAIVGNILALGVDPVQVDRLPVHLHTVVRVLVCNNFIFSQFAACRDISSDFMILYFLFSNLWKQLWVYFIMWKRESSFFWDISAIDEDYLIWT